MPLEQIHPMIVHFPIVLALLALLLPGAHWLFWGFFPFLFFFWLAASLAGIFAMTRFRRHPYHRWDGSWHPHG